MIRHKNLGRLDHIFEKFLVHDVINCNTDVDVFENLKIVLKKFKKIELLSLVFETCRIPYDADIHKRLTKYELVDHIILELRKENISTVEDMSVFLHLKHIQIYKNSKTWSAIKVEDATNLIRPETTAEKFGKVLQKNLNRFDYISRVISEKERSFIWTVISAVNGSPKQNMTFLMAFVKSPLILYCCLKPKYAPSLNSALVQSFKGTGVTDLCIKGKCIESIIHFGYKACASENQAPLSPSITFPVRQSVQDTQLDFGVVNDSSEEQKRKKKYLKETFRDNVQPPIEKLTYNINTDFMGFDKSDISTTCRVVFKGNNVLEGLHELVNCGIAKYPMVETFDEAVNSGRHTFRYRQIHQQSSNR